MIGLSVKIDFRHRLEVLTPLSLPAITPQALFKMIIYSFVTNAMALAFTFVKRILQVKFLIYVD